MPFCLTVLNYPSFLGGAERCRAVVRSDRLVALLTVILENRENAQQQSWLLLPHRTDELPFGEQKSSKPAGVSK